MGSGIEVEIIGQSRYAPLGSKAVCLYGVNGVEGLTLSQLIMAVCIKRATLDELMAVRAMNNMSADAKKLEATALVVEQIMAEGSSWDQKIDIASSGYVPTQVGADATLWDFVTKELGIPAANLPVKLSTSGGSDDNRLLAADQITPVMDQLNRTAEEASIRLQTILGRRDVEYRTAGSTTTAISKCAENTANAILGRG